MKRGVKTNYLFTIPVNMMITGIVAFTILINLFIPRFAVKQAEYDMLSEILQSQSALICFISFSSIPLRIVSELFSDQRTTSRKPVKGGEERENTSSDYLITANDKKLSDTRSGFNGMLKNLDSGLKGFFVIDDKIGNSPGERVRGDIIVIFLAFLVLLPRSGLPDNANIININNLKSPSLNY